VANITIRLTYNVKTDKLPTKPSQLRVKQFDTLTFESTQGPVSVRLVPARLFSASEFHTGDPPITVKKAERFRFMCGVTIGKTHYGWPETNKFGNHGDPKGG
jgi:hypothetical protein